MGRRGKGGASICAKQRRAAAPVAVAEEGCSVLVACVAPADDSFVTPMHLRFGKVGLSGLQARPPSCGRHHVKKSLPHFDSLAAECIDSKYLSKL